MRAPACALRRLVATAIVAGSVALALAAATNGEAVTATPPVAVLLTDSGSGPSVTLSLGTWTNTGLTPTATVSAVVADGTCNAGISITPSSFTLSGAGSSTSLTIQCDSSTVNEIRRCQFHARRSDDQTLGSVTALCVNAATTQLAYAGPNPRDLGAPVVGTSGAFVPVSITNNGSAMTRISVQLADQDGNFKLGAPCVPGVVGCTVEGFNVGMGNSFTVDAQCTPQVAGPLSTTLYVVGGNGARLASPIMLTCNAGAGSGAALSANPAQLTLHAPVNGSSSTNVRITSGGTAPASITSIAVIGLNAGEWTATPGGACVTGSCTLPPGQFVDIELALAPPMIGTRMATLRITTAPVGQVLDVPLTGIGDQGVLAFEGAVEPPLDLGTFPIGVTGGRMINLRNNGNVALGPVDVTIPAGSGAFAVTPGALASLGLPPQLGQLMVTCTPGTADTFTETLHVVAPNELTTQVLDLDVQCTGTTSNLYATSGAIGEIRRNAGVARQQIELRTAGPSLTVTSPPTLATPTSGLTIAGLTSSSIVFQQDPPVSFALEVDPTAFPDGPIANTINVSAQPMAAPVEAIAIPVSGRIVTPAIEVPATVVAGSFCINQPTTSTTARIRASGTASILVGQPVMERMASSPFQLTNGSPASYPFDLPSLQTASIEVTPLQQATPGVQSDTLRWATDVTVEGELAVTPTTVSAEFIATGGAIAPSLVDFGATPVRTAAPPRTIRIQNCGTDEITLAGLQIVPTDEFRDVSTTPLPVRLAPKQTVTIDVGFTPRRTGPRAATLTVASSMGNLTSNLIGQGVGDAEAIGDVRSLYACSCSGPGAPARGWPIALALVLIVRRRRC